MEGKNNSKIKGDHSDAIVSDTKITRVMPKLRSDGFNYFGHRHYGKSIVLLNAAEIFMRDSKALTAGQCRAKKEAVDK